MSEIMAAWKCGGKDGHVLGQVMRNASRVRVLLLYRNAVEAEEGDVDVLTILDGQATDVKCSICGKVRTWVPGEEAMRKLLRDARKYNEKRKMVLTQCKKSANIQT